MRTERLGRQTRRGWQVLVAISLLGPIAFVTVVSASEEIPRVVPDASAESTLVETSLTETSEPVETTEPAIATSEPEETTVPEVVTSEPSAGTTELPGEIVDPSVETLPVVDSTDLGVDSTVVDEASTAPDDTSPPTAPAQPATTAAPTTTTVPSASPTVEVESQIALLAAAPTTAPAWPWNVRARAGNEVVNVTWNAPTRDGGSSIQRYFVQRSTNAAEWVTVAIVPAAARQARVGGLSNGSRYYFRVVAENAVGRSGPSWWAVASPSATATGLPLHPHGLQLYAGNGAAVLSWKAPIRDVGGPVLSYRVQRSTNGSRWLTIAWVPATQRSLTVTGLSNGTGYYFRVIAVNANGAGTPSWWERATPAADNPYTPIHPSGLRATVGNQQLTVRWNAPAYGPRPLTYRVQITAHPDLGWLTVAWVPASTPAATLSGLRNGVRYYVRVVPVNAYGAGDPSWWAAGTPAASLSSGPVGPVASNFDVSRYLNSRGIPESTAHEPSGNFRTVCEVSHLAYDDPIVYPGQPDMAHLHMFFGNTEADANSTYESLRTTGGSTCEGGPINRSAYWVPAMFDGNGQVVAPHIIVVYYKGVASGGSLARQQEAIQQVQPLPPGLRMVAGAPSGHVSWQCADGSGQGRTIPSGCPAGQDLIATITFPNCWDGRNLDSTNHRSHMAYKYYDTNGVHRCPSSHPVELVQISEKIFYPAAPDVGTWSISSDMGAARGSTLHADWFGAWDPAVLRRWHDNCIIEMRNSNNGDLCDGQGLTSATNYTGPTRRAGFTPMVTMHAV